MGQTITKTIKRYWRKKKTTKGMPNGEDKTIWQKIKDFFTK